MNESDRYWFPAKRYGWGWGPPVRWQGWIVLILYIVVVMGWSLKFLPNQHPFLFLAGLILPTAVLLLICWKKGEPPAWRWGGRDLG